MGVPCLKNPLDTWVYQEIIYRNKPDLIIECGTNQGGSAYYFAHLLDLIGHGRLVSIDINENPGKPVHPRVEYLVMSSTSPECEAAIRERVRSGEKVMVPSFTMGELMDSGNVVIVFTSTTAPFDEAL